jgi:ethanolamine utilization protein EutQ
LKSGFDLSGRKPLWMQVGYAFKTRGDVELSTAFQANTRLEQNENMPTLISQPTRIQAAGNKPKLIDEYVGRVNSKTSGVSVAHMRTPEGWVEPGQTPEFDEFTIVLRGKVLVSYQGGEIEVKAGQAVIAHAGEWVRYSTPEGAEYIAVCLPAFSMEVVHRDGEEGGG